MSRRSRTTLTIQIKLPLPPGATQKDATAFIEEAIVRHKAIIIPAPMAALQLPEVQVRIVQRDTHYL